MLELHISDDGYVYVAAKGCEVCEYDMRVFFNTTVTVGDCRDDLTAGLMLSSGSKRALTVR